MKQHQKKSIPNLILILITSITVQAETSDLSKKIDSLFGDRSEKTRVCCRCN